jgi:hypothetical protein
MLGSETVAQYLLRQFSLTFDSEFRFRVGGARSRLSAANSNAVSAAGNNAISFVVYLAEIARIQNEVDMLCVSRTYMDSRESA